MLNCVANLLTSHALNMAILKHCNALKLHRTTWSKIFWLGIIRTAELPAEATPQPPINLHSQARADIIEDTMFSDHLAQAGSRQVAGAAASQAQGRPLRGHSLLLPPRPEADKLQRRQEGGTPLLRSPESRQRQRWEGSLRRWEVACRSLLRHKNQQHRQHRSPTS